MKTQRLDRHTSVAVPGIVCRIGAGGMGVSYRASVRDLRVGTHGQNTFATPIEFTGVANAQVLIETLPLEKSSR